MAISRPYIFLATILVAIPLASAQADQPAEHLSPTCATCHDHHPDGELPVDETCLGCHEPWLPEHDAVAGVFHDPDDRACSRCHGYHSTEKLKATGNMFLRPFGDQQVLRHCSSCHRNDEILDNVSAGHVTAAALHYHVDAGGLLPATMSEICLRCHDEESDDSDTPPETPTFPAHASHPIGLTIPPYSPWEHSEFQVEIHPELELFDGHIECITCHRLPATTVFRLVPLPSVTAICNGCHNMAPGQSADFALKSPTIRTTEPALTLATSALPR